MTSISNQHLIDSFKLGDYSLLKTIFKETHLEFSQWAFSHFKVNRFEAEEIFQSSLIIFYEKIISDKFDLTSQWKTYLFAIGKNKIREHLRAQDKLVSLQDFEGLHLESDEDNDDAQVDEQSALVIKCLEELGDPCKDLIVEYYYNNLSLEIVSSKLGYKNANSAKNQKFKCMQRLKDLFLNQYKAAS